MFTNITSGVGKSAVGRKNGGEALKKALPAQNQT